jgi:hypothetical protein
VSNATALGGGVPAGLVSLDRTSGQLSQPSKSKLRRTEILAAVFMVSLSNPFPGCQTSASCQGKNRRELSFAPV